jgi:hypothetical protein
MPAQPSIPSQDRPHELGQFLPPQAQQDAFNAAMDQVDDRRADVRLSEAVAEQLWFEWCDYLGYPNGEPIWAEMVAAGDPRVEKFRAMAVGAVRVVQALTFMEPQ